METNKEAIRVMENALFAIDTNIRNLVLTKTALEDQLVKLRQGTPEKPDPLATFGEPELDTPCEHLDCSERNTMGQTWWLCNSCGEMVEQ